MKKFLTGMLIGVLVCSSVTVALASTGSQSIIANYRNIKVAVNDAIVALTDANGNTVEPFIYNGTTYLPVRGVATALGQQVSWDPSTYTVYIGSHSTSSSSTSSSSSSSTPANTVIFNQAGITVTYLGFKRDTSLDADKFEFKIENNSSEKYAVYTQDCRIENVNASEGIYESVDTGTISYATTYIWDSELKDNYHLDSYSEYSFKLVVTPYDYESTGAKITSDEITIVK